MASLREIRGVGVALAFAFAVSAEAKEVRVFPFAFEIPDAWSVDGGNGEQMLYATGAAEMYHTPFLLAETCVSTKDKDCGKDRLDPFPYDPSTQKEAYEQNYRSLGCQGSPVTAIPRENNILEKRLLCSSVGYSLFITEASVLWVAYSPAEGGKGIPEFLDAIAASLKVR